jgi:hypothetical protein
MMNLRLYLFLSILTLNAFVGVLTTMLFPGADRVGRLAVAAGDALMITMAASCSFRNRNFYGVKLGGAILFASFLTFAYNVDRFGFMPHLNGMREVLFFIAALIVVFDLYESDVRRKLIVQITLFIIVFAILQTPVSILQYVKYGAGDLVGGTYGIKGGSGMITQDLFLITAFLIIRYGVLEDGTSVKFSRALLIFPLLIPCGVNETKITFVLLPALFLLLVSSRGKLYRTVPLVLLGAGLVYLFYYAYQEVVRENQNIFTADYFEKYLMTSPTGRGGDLPRFQRLIIMFNLMHKDVVYYVLGMGYGLIGGGNVLEVSRDTRALVYLISGSRILLFRLWIQGGILLVAGVAAMMFSYLRATLPLRPADKRLALFIAFNLALVWVYNEAILDRTYACLVSFAMIWLYRGGSLNESGDETEDESQDPTEASAAAAP